MTGVLPSQQIEAMIDRGAIPADAASWPGQIQPASLDLRLGTMAYRVRASFLAGQRAQRGATGWPNSKCTGST